MADVRFEHLLVCGGEAMLLETSGGDSAREEDTSANAFPSRACVSIGVAKRGLEALAVFELLSLGVRMILERLSECCSCTYLRGDWARGVPQRDSEIFDSGAHHDARESRSDARVSSCFRGGDAHGGPKPFSSTRQRDADIGRGSVGGARSGDDVVREQGAGVLTGMCPIGEFPNIRRERSASSFADERNAETQVVLGTLTGTRALTGALGEVSDTNCERGACECFVTGAQILPDTLVE